MAIATPVNRRRSQQQRLLATAFQLLRFDVQRGLGGWRWWFVVPVFGILGTFYAGTLKFDFVQQQPRLTNIWDTVPAVMTHHWFNTWLVAIGFALLVGDSYVRDREQQQLALTLSRVPSRTAWWLAKLGSVGVLALCYVAIVIVALLVGSAFSTSVALSDSPRSLVPTTWNDGWYFRLMQVPMPLFVVLVGLYTAFTLWIIGCVVLLSSLIWQRTVVPFAVIVGWVLIGRTLEAPVLSSIPYSRVLAIPQFVDYAKHGEPVPSEYVSLPGFIALALGILATVFVLGAWRLRRIDV